jgi:thioesterase domain-containing protein
MHGAGGTVLMYRDLSRHLGDDQPFYGLQSQGLDGSCPPLTSVAEMAAVYVKEIRRVQPHGPYFIAGYCMGGTVAFEVAQQLHELGEPIALLALFDTMNWHKIPLTFWNLSSHTSQRLFFHAGSFLSLDSRGKAEFLREKWAILRSRIPVWRGSLLSRFGKHSSNTASDALILGQIWQANDRASWAYLPKFFPGVVTDIRPAKQYRIFSKPDLKWDHRVARTGRDRSAGESGQHAGRAIRRALGERTSAVNRFRDSTLQSWLIGRNGRQCAAATEELIDHRERVVQDLDLFRRGLARGQHRNYGPAHACCVALLDCL